MTGNEDVKAAIWRYSASSGYVPRTTKRPPDKTAFSWIKRLVVALGRAAAARQLYPVRDDTTPGLEIMGRVVQLLKYHLGHSKMFWVVFSGQYFAHH